MMSIKSNSRMCDCQIGQYSLNACVVRATESRNVIDVRRILFIAEDKRINSVIFYTNKQIMTRKWHLIEIPFGCNKLSSMISTSGIEREFGHLNK